MEFFIDILWYVVYNGNKLLRANRVEVYMDESNIQLFEDKRIRTAWDEENEEWLFSIVDVVGALTEQPTQRNASTYWAVMKKRLADEGASQLLTNCKQLRLKAADGKRYRTDVANTDKSRDAAARLPETREKRLSLIQVNLLSLLKMLLISAS